MFPVGLVFLFVRESIRLDVAVFDGPTGVVVRLSGNTESVVLERVRTALIASAACRQLGPDAERRLPAPARICRRAAFAASGPVVVLGGG